MEEIIMICRKKFHQPEVFSSLLLIFASAAFLLSGCGGPTVDLYERAGLLHSQGNFEAAINDYTGFIRLNPDYIDAYYKRGRSYEARGDYYKAIEDYNKYIAVKPNIAQAYLSRANAFRNTSRYDKAVADFDKAIEVNPEYAQAYFSRAVIYEIKGRDDKAVSDYTRCIELNPEYVNAYNRLSAYNNRAIACYRMGQYEKAWDDVYKAEGLDCPLSDDFIDKLRKASGRQR